MKKLGNWFKGHRVLRVVLPTAIALLLVVALVTPAALATAPTFPNVAGTYTVQCNLNAKFLDTSRAITVKTGTLSITGSTVTSKGVISTASLTLDEIGTVALTGFVGTGRKPTLSLVGADGSINVIINARVKLDKSGAVSVISGKIDGWQGHFGAELGNDINDGNACGAATWNSTTVHGGSSAALLTHAAYEGSVYVQFVPPAGFKLSDLGSITSGWGIWHLFQLSSTYGPQVELRFVAPTNVNPGGAGHVDVTVVTTPFPMTGTGEWVNWLITSASKAVYFGNDPYDGTGFYNLTEAPLSGILAAINNESAMKADGGFSAAGWTLSRVRVERWYQSIATCYIDDVSVKIKGKTYTYTFEPVQFSGGFSARP